MLTVNAERLRELLDYNPDTGVFTWKMNRGRVKSGSIAGKTDGQGYRAIPIDGQLMRAHRLAWLYVNDFLPAMEIDHINGVRSDNRISNLRLVTHSENMQNQRKPQSDSKSGFLGVRPLKGKYAATIVIHNKSIHLGLFDSPEKAHDAYINAKRVHHQYGTL